MMSRLFKILVFIASTMLIAIHARADFDFIRYDVSFDSPNVSGQGYMLFNNHGPVPGNIFPNIEDWEFTINGFVYDPSNTLPWDQGYFSVDENYGQQSDLLLGGFRPCFAAINEDCVFDGSSSSIFISFSASQNSIYYRDDSSTHLEFDAVGYTGVSFIDLPNPVPATPGFALALLGVAITGVVALARRGQWGR